MPFVVALLVSMLVAFGAYAYAPPISQDEAGTTVVIRTPPPDFFEEEELELVEAAEALPVGRVVVASLAPLEIPNLLRQYIEAAKLPEDCTNGPRCPGLVTLRTRSGKPYTVTAGAARSFRGFIGWLESTGYRIDAIGCVAVRRIAGTRTWSNHARATACDVNQTARNRVTRPLPPNTTTKAAEFGLLHGAVWRNPDTGHFELMASKQYALLTKGKTQYAGVKKKYRYAKRSKKIKYAQYQYKENMNGAHR